MSPALYYEAEDADAIMGAWSDNGDVVTFWMDDAATQDVPQPPPVSSRPQGSPKRLHKKSYSAQ